MRSPRCAIVYGVILALQLSTSPAVARIWRVTPDGSGDAPTIRAAVDSADAGDTVLLAAGTYSYTSQGIVAQPPDFGMIRIFKALTLRGESGAEMTILDAELQARIIYCENAGAVSVEGLTLKRGIGYGKLCGAGMFSDENTQPTISNCIIVDCRSGGDGGGLCVSNAVITHCVVRDCYAQDRRGGGIVCENSTITNCQILSNRVRPQEGNGGGIYCRDTTVRNCLIQGNWVLGDGGAFGGGIYVESGGEIDNCWIEGNTARDAFTCGAGGVYARTAPVRNCVFVNNSCLTIASSRRPRGGGLLTSGPVMDCIFVGNRAISGGLSAEGGAVYGEFVGFSMTRCTVVGNAAIGGPSPIGGVFAAQSGAVTSTIIAWNEGLPCGGNPSLSCSDVFGNSLGDALCGTDAGGNFSRDPEFCASDPVGTLNFTLQADSPCLPEHHPSGASCGTIGAQRSGCGTVSVEQRTWGNVKGLYR